MLPCFLNHEEIRNICKWICGFPQFIYEIWILVWKPEPQNQITKNQNYILCIHIITTNNLRQIRSLIWTHTTVNILTTVERYWQLSTCLCHDNITLRCSLTSACHSILQISKENGKYNLNICISTPPTSSIHPQGLLSPQPISSMNGPLDVCKSGRN